VDQLLVALDVESRAEAVALADRLRGAVGGFKIGSRLFTAEGPDMVRALVDRGDRVFLDLKWHDIPNTVATAVAAASNLGVWMVNVHASGGSAMLRAAGESARDTAARLGRDAPLVIAVTVLTSMNQASLRETGIVIDLMDQVLRLAELTKEAGRHTLALRQGLRNRDPGDSRRRRERREGRPGANDVAGGGGCRGRKLPGGGTPDHRRAGPAGCGTGNSEEYPRLMTHDSGLEAQGSRLMAHAG